MTKIEEYKVSKIKVLELIDSKNGITFGQNITMLGKKACYADIFRLSRRIPNNNRMDMFHLLFVGHDPYPFDLKSIIDELNTIFSETLDIKIHNTIDERVKLIEIIMKRDMTLLFIEMVYYILLPIFRVMDKESPFMYIYNTEGWIGLEPKTNKYDGEIINNIYDLLFTYYNILGKTPHHDVNEIMGEYRDNPTLLKKLIENFISCNQIIFGTLDFDLMDKKLENKSKTYAKYKGNSIYGVGRTGSFTFIEKLAKGKL